MINLYRLLVSGFASCKRGIAFFGHPKNGRDPLILKPQSTNAHRKFLNALQIVPKKKEFFLVYLLALVSLSSLCQGTVKIKFLNSANGRIIIGPDSIYRNFLNEPYSISKLKYYISNVSFGKKTKNVFLIDAYAQDSLILDVPVGRYNSFSFLMGVDSIANCSGAQDGALDPLNDMFWAWNSGYVMFKLEGNSDSSKADLKRIEHHIGGYRGKYKTMREVDLVFEQPLIIENREEHSIRIEMNLDNYWRSMHNISIYKTPVIVTAGPAAMLSADNFPFLFKIISIE